MANLNEIAKQLVNLTVKEANELCEILKEEHGIEPAASGSFMAPSDSMNKAEVVKEQTEFDVILKGVGANKLAVVRLVKELIGIGLKDAKELVDSAPKSLKEKISKEDAETMKKQFEEAGAEVELK